MSKIENVIPALDDLSLEEVRSLLPILSQHFSVVKIGLELFLREGRSLLLEIHQQFGLEIFLDLKLHDIPNTVSKAIKSLEGLPVKFLTIHASGGEKMMKEAMASQQKHLPKTTILAVTLLTSLDGKDQKNIYNRENGIETVVALMELAKRSGINAFVCAAADLNNLPLKLKDSIFVTPGIRFEGDEKGDQVRILTPKEAMNSGAKYLVMGRSLLVGNNLPLQIAKLRNSIAAD